MSFWELFVAVFLGVGCWVVGIIAGAAIIARGQFNNEQRRLIEEGPELPEEEVTDDLPPGEGQPSGD